VNAKLDEWVQAKRAKDFTTSDRLRDELRAQGIDPDTVRPSDRATIVKQDFGGPVSAPWYQTAPMMPSMVQTPLMMPSMVQTPPMMPSMVPPPPPPAMHAPPVYDTEINKLLDEWVQAKRAKDFTTSDKIRDTLRARNVDPDTERPRGREGGYPTSHQAGKWGGTPPPPPPWAGAPHMPMYGGAMDGYGMRGPPPPPQRAPRSVPPPAYDEEINKMLDEWVQAKRAKDFTTSDKLRDTLRARNVDPDTARPADGRYVPPTAAAAAPWHQAAGGYQPPPWAEGPSPEVLLNDWEQAKQARDFDKSDMIRKQLRAMGVEPDPGGRHVMPAGYDAGYNPAYASPMPNPAMHYPPMPNPAMHYPPMPAAMPPILTPPVPTPASHVSADPIEAQLDQWVQAKRAKDFTTADAIRNDLRAKGVDPDTARPSNTARR